MLVDEAQFLTPAQVKQLGAVVDELNIPVLCYGLRTDFRGEMFPGSAQLLAWADNNGIALTPRGKATSGYGGVLPVKGGVVCVVASR